MHSFDSLVVSHCKQIPAESPRAELFEKLAQYTENQRKSNNWRRMHGYPLRRKGKGRKKRGRGGPYIRFSL